MFGVCFPCGPLDMSYFPLFVTFSLLALDNFSFTYLSTSPVSFIAVFEVSFQCFRFEIVVPVFFSEVLSSYLL